MSNRKEDSNFYEDKLRKHYTPLLEKYGSTYQAVDWGSEKGQSLRLDILLQVDDLKRADILDVGCGVGHLVNHLKKSEFKGSYLGTDLLSDAVRAAEKTYPDWKFKACDVLTDSSDIVADYILGSGLFTFATWEQMKRFIASMFRISRKAVAFNSLSSWTNKQQSGELYADPAEVLSFCRTLTPWVTLRHDYMAHDFTIYMYREQHTK